MSAEVREVRMLLQVKAELVSVDGRVAATASRPCTITYRSPVVRMLRQGRGLLTCAHMLFPPRRVAASGDCLVSEVPAGSRLLQVNKMRGCLAKLSPLMREVDVCCGWPAQDAGEAADNPAGVAQGRAGAARAPVPALP